MSQTHNLASKLKDVFRTAGSGFSNNTMDENNHNLFSDASEIINEARKQAYSAINTALVKRNWLLGPALPKNISKGKHERAMERKSSSDFPKIS